MADSKPIILCVDDEATPLMLRKSVLEKLGYEVVPALSGAEALQILDARSVDLVLTDLLMPGISGTDLARQVKQTKPAIPVVLFSGVNEIPEDATYADLFLSKVEGPVSVAAKLRELLKNSRARQAAAAEPCA